MQYSKFDYRRIFKWGDFLEEMEEKYPINHELTKDEKETLEKMISKGNDLQEQLNEKYEYGDFTWYINNMKKYIHIQDELIDDIILYRENLKKWYKEVDNVKKK
jgi:lipopolysaccharide export LptBFGC system permease protein LptF